MNNFKRHLFASVLLILTGPSPVFGSADVMDYEAIVDDLKGSTQMSVGDTDPWSRVLIHSSIGFATTFIDVEPENGPSASGLLSGIEVGFGVDLFSPAWKAEGALRSYNTGRLDSNTSVSLKEFDLKLLHMSSLSSRLKMEIGGGLAARYLTTRSPFTKQSEYTTPASIIGVGLRSQLTKMVGLGVDISLRTSLIDESIDRSSVSGSLKINALF